MKPFPIIMIFLSVGIIIALIATPSTKIQSPDKAKPVTETKTPEEPKTLDTAHILKRFDERVQRAINALDRLEPQLEMSFLDPTTFYDQMFDEKSILAGPPQLRSLGSESIQKYNTKLVSLQKKAFPILRKKYIEKLHKALWVEDIEVKSMNKTNDRIRFIGGTFAANRNKQDMQKALQSDFNKFRFKRSEYLWYKYDEEYTYYTISSADDGDIK